MRLDKKIANVYSDETERFFVGLWHSLVHRESLDSHRVRCMDALNIAIELRLLLFKRYQADKQNDLRLVTEEAMSILTRDKVILSHFSHHLDNIKILSNQILGSSKENKEETCTLMSYYLRHLIADLEVGYKARTIEQLEKAIFVMKNKDDIFHFTNILLSRLVDEGHSLEGLFAFYRNIFVDNRSAVVQGLPENYRFLTRIITRPDATYEVLLALEGDIEDVFLSYPMPELTFTREIKDIGPIQNVMPSRQGSNFLAPKDKKFYARVEVVAQDDRSAGIAAKEKLADYLDLLRFAIEPNVVIQPHFVAVRKEDGSARHYPIPDQIPNPLSAFSDADFRVFGNNVTQILNRENITEETKSRVRSALRFYRMGREVEHIENKFLNWWAALEYLIGADGNGVIITGIETKLISVLSLGYVSKFLETYRAAFAYCQILPIDVDATYTFPSFVTVSNEVMLEIIRTPARLNTVLARCSKHPQLVYQLTWFAQQMQDTKTIREFLERHKQRLNWHIHRIYRVRNDIVHSARYALSLTLLCANLEYYLKQAIIFVVSNLQGNPAIETLDEVYARAGHTQIMLFRELNDKKEDLLRHLLRGGSV